jgi:hypothetical protein
MLLFLLRPLCGEKDTRMQIWEGRHTARLSPQLQAKLCTANVACSVIQCEIVIRFQLRCAALMHDVLTAVGYRSHRCGVDRGTGRHGCNSFLWVRFPKACHNQFSKVDLLILNVGSAMIAILRSHDLWRRIQTTRRWFSESPTALPRVFCSIYKQSYSNSIRGWLRRKVSI